MFKRLLQRRPLEFLVIFVVTFAVLGYLLLIVYVSNAVDKIGHY